MYHVLEDTSFSVCLSVCLSLYPSQMEESASVLLVFWNEGFISSHGAEKWRPHWMANIFLKQFAHSGPVILFHLHLLLLQQQQQQQQHQKKLLMTRFKLHNPNVESEVNKILCSNVLRRISFWCESNNFISGEKYFFRNIPFMRMINWGLYLWRSSNIWDLLHIIDNNAVKRAFWCRWNGEREST